MGPWIEINEGAIPCDALVLFYAKPDIFACASGMDKDRVLEHHPGVTHYRIICEAPGA